MDVDLVYLGGGARPVPALLSNSIQLFFGSDTAAYVAAIQGAKVVKLGVTMNTLGYFLMTAPEIRSIADLKGKVLGIGLGRDLPYAHLTKILRDNGIDPKTDVKILPLGGGPGVGRLEVHSFLSSRVVVTPVKTGVHPHPLTWIPFPNGMTDAVCHLDAGFRRHDELSLA